MPTLPSSGWRVTIVFTDGERVCTVYAENEVQALSMALQDARMGQTGPAYSTPVVEAKAIAL